MPETSIFLVLKHVFVGCRFAFIFFILLGPEHLSMNPPPPPPNNKKNKGATISHALAQSVCLLVFVDISLIVSCFVSRPIFHSLLFSLKKLLFSKFGGIYIFNYFSFFHSLNHSFLFLPSPLVLCSFYVSLSICTLSLCLTLPYYILATTVVCCNLIADNALSFPLFLFDQL